MKFTFVRPVTKGITKKHPEYVYNTSLMKMVIVKRKDGSLWWATTEDSRFSGKHADIEKACGLQPGECDRVFNRFFSFH